MEPKKVILIGLLAALVAVTTMVVNVPLPGVKGYVNVGDTVVLLAGFLFGPLVGGLAGSLGSGLADLLLGFAHWAPWTFLIKGLEGYLAGWLVWRKGRNYLFAGAVGVAAMISGYFLVGILYYGFGPAILSLPGDLLQGAVSVLITLVIGTPLKKYLNLRG